MVSGSIFIFDSDMVCLFGGDNFNNKSFFDENKKNTRLKNTPL